MEEIDMIKKVFKGIGFAVLGIFLLSVLLGSFFVVGSGERGVVVSAFHGTKQASYGEGFHFKAPLVDHVTKMEVRTQKYEVLASAASKDLQDVQTTVAVNYHLEADKAHAVYQKLGANYQERIIAPSVQEVVKAVTAKYNAEELITKRETVKEAIKAGLRERLTQDSILLDDLSITNFNFSPEFNHAIEAKVTQEQNALAEQNRLKVVEFQAQQKIAEARGQAEAARIISQELEKNPNYIQYLMMQKWDGKMPLALGASNTLLQLPVTQ